MLLSLIRALDGKALNKRTSLRSTNRIAAADAVAPKPTEMRPDTGRYNALASGSQAFQSGAANLIAGCIDYLLPKRCVLCFQICDSGYCLPCQQLLPWIETHCQRCAAPLSAGAICGNCQARLPVHQQIQVPFRYSDPISSHVHHLKYRDQILYADALANMLAIDIVKQCRQPPQVLVPVPLHPNRLRQRGYNQAALIARSLGRKLNIPVNEELVRRSRDTASQTRFSRKQRSDNIKNAFSANIAPRYHGIAVVDDVITSGATVGEVGRTLLKAGHRNISVWAVAKT